MLVARAARKEFRREEPRVVIDKRASEDERCVRQMRYVSRRRAPRARHAKMRYAAGSEAYADEPARRGAQCAPRNNRKILKQQAAAHKRGARRTGSRARMRARRAPSTELDAAMRSMCRPRAAHGARYFCSARTVGGG